MYTEEMGRFLVVAFCFASTFYLGKNKYYYDQTDTLLLRIGMLLTVIADYFLILTEYYALGLLFFCSVQLVYSYRYTGQERIKLEILVGLGAFAIVGVLSGFNIILCLGALYAVFMAFSVSGAIMSYGKFPYPMNTLIVLGMVLFLLCDICVLLYNTTFAGSAIGGTLYKMIWLFYLPSQALICSSAKLSIEEEEDEKEEHHSPY